MAVEGEVGLGLLVPGFGGRPVGGTSLRLRGTGLFCNEEKEPKAADWDAACGGSGGSQGGAGGESSVRSISRGAAPAVWAGNPSTGVLTSGTTRASGGILGKESFLGPPQAEQDRATGVLWRVQRGQAHPECWPSGHPTSPLLSERRSTSSLAGC